MKKYLFAALIGMAFTLGLDFWFIPMDAQYLGLVMLGIVGFGLVYVHLISSLKRTTKRRFLDQSGQSHTNPPKL